MGHGFHKVCLQLECLWDSWTPKITQIRGISIIDLFVLFVRAFVQRAMRKHLNSRFNQANAKIRSIETCTVFRFHSRFNIIHVTHAFSISFHSNQFLPFRLSSKVKCCLWLHIKYYVTFIFISASILCAHQRNINKFTEEYYVSAFSE